MEKRDMKIPVKTKFFSSAYNGKPAFDMDWED